MLHVVSWPKCILFHRRRLRILHRAGPTGSNGGAGQGPPQKAHRSTLNRPQAGFDLCPTGNLGIW